MGNGEQLKGHLDLLLLATLAKGPAHGYAVIELLRATSDGTFDLPVGTVSPAHNRLVGAGILQSHWAAGNARKRRVYSLTAPGIRALTEQAEQWRVFAGSVNVIVGAVA
jgi:DNA-binding PadR family transcriptional regulator